jgi:hypothetical protein
LSCDGKVTNLLGESEKPEIIAKMGVSVNLREGSVLGFANPARIRRTDAVSVEFSGVDGNWSIQGSIDRITGSVNATTMVVNRINKDKLIASNSWDLQCSPAKRVF